MSALSSLFTSHSSRDHAIALEVGRRLRAEGYTDLLSTSTPSRASLSDATGNKRCTRSQFHQGTSPRRSAPGESGQSTTDQPRRSCRTRRAGKL